MITSDGNINSTSFMALKDGTSCGDLRAFNCCIEIARFFFHLIHLTDHSFELLGQKIEKFVSGLEIYIAVVRSLHVIFFPIRWESTVIAMWFPLLFIELVNGDTLDPVVNCLFSLVALCSVCRPLTRMVAATFQWAYRWSTVSSRISVVTFLGMLWLAARELRVS